MIKMNKWFNYVKRDELPDNGLFACQPTDQVLDEDSWPIWTVMMVGGIITNQENLYAAPHGGYAVEDMTGWTKAQFVEWLQYDGSSQPEQMANNAIWLSDIPKQGGYWFCVALNTDIERQLALSIMAYYKVRGYAVGNGDKAEFMVIDEETRDGDLVLAEMAFNGCGSIVWRQASVCPICEDKGETTCGHMYFNQAVEAAF